MKKHIILIFLIVFSTHFFSKVSYITDSRWTLHSAWAIVHQHNLQLDRFKPAIEQNNYYAIEEQSGHLYYIFPPGTPLLCAPLLAVLEVLAEEVFYIDILPLLEESYSGGMELFLAAFFVALSAVFLYLILRQWKISSWLTFFCVIFFAYGTSVWSTASRGLFAHGPSIFTILFGIWSLAKSGKNHLWLFVAGLLFGFSYIVRPTNSISLIVFGLYVLWTYRLNSWRFYVTAGMVLALFFVYNHHVYNSFFSPYFSPDRVNNSPSFFAGLCGNLFSPSRGLFTTSPMFVLIPVLILLQFKDIRNHAFSYALLSIVVLHVYIISSLDNWTAGWCFGSRFCSEIIPHLTLLLALLLHSFFETQRSSVRKTAFITLGVLLLASCYINYQGANNPKTFEWNYSPSNIDENRGRVWDWSDPQFMRK